MSFIRILSVGGLILSGDGVRPEEKRERIRIAIFEQHLEHKPFDASRSFGQAYQQCYRRPLDMRKLIREPAPVSPKAAPIEHEDESEEQ